MRVPRLKRQADAPIQRIESPDHVQLSLTGLAPVVAVGDAVTVGDLVARPANGSTLSSRLHSPLTGAVASIAGGTMVIDGEWAVFPASARDDDVEQIGPDEIIAVARDAGLVGMGGAMFPTHVKLKNDRRLDCVIVNGCESEPYLTGDHRVLEEHGDAVESGMHLAMRAVGAEQGIVAGRRHGYLDGYDRFLVREILGREVPAGGIPPDVGAVVFNVQTVRALHEAVLRGQPLIERVLTVDGEPFGRCGNFCVPIGTRVGHVLDVCECDMSRTAQVVLGGPFMGTPADRDTPITAGTGGVLALTEDQGSSIEDAPCIRCGLCLEECPVGLCAAQVARRPTREALLCIECGVCQFVCPARRPLVAMIRSVKAAIRDAEER